MARKPIIHFLTYEEVKERDPFNYFSIRLGVEPYFIQELYRMCEVDFRFSKHEDSTKEWYAHYVEYKQISRYVRLFWKITIKPRKVAYIHRVIRRHNQLLTDLKKYKRREGTYRQLVFRKA